MFGYVQGRSRGLLVSLAVMAIALSGCSGSTGSAAPSDSAAGASSSDADGGSGSGAGLSGASSAFSGLNSYKFTMTLTGDDAVSGLPPLPGSSASDTTSVRITGTEIVKPEKAVDIEVSGFHIIEIGGFDYIDTGDNGGFIKIETTKSLADSFSPVLMFSSAIAPSTASGYTKVGTETKNGVQADHFQASSAALAELGSVTGVTGTWTADVWIATSGGYPVSVAVIAKATDNSVAYQVSFDISNANDASNKVTAPTNVTGV